MASLMLEVLEVRNVPAVVTLRTNVVVVTGTPNNDNVEIYTLQSKTCVGMNGSTYRINGVVSVVVALGQGDDNLTNRTSLPMHADLGAGNDRAIGGNGNDYIDGSAGKDLVYDLIGSNIVQSRDGFSDRVYVNDASVAVTEAIDEVAKFFAANRTPGLGTIFVENRVLYITPANLDSTTRIDRVGNEYVVAYDFGSGKNVFKAPVASVRLVAYFGGIGNDKFVNNTNLNVVAYGGLGGNDVLLGGYANNLLKGGSGDDVVIGRGSDDLSGDGGNDVLVGDRNDVFRGDLNDVIFVSCRKRYGI